MSTATEHPAFTRAKKLPMPVRAYFPTSTEEAMSWSAKHLRMALDSKVLVVAVPRIECAWAAYIAAVPGQDHSDEAMAVWQHGTKLPEAVARAVFPFFGDVPYAW